MNNIPNTAPYLEQAERWPESGQHILAHYDDGTIIVYQAYNPSIGQYAIRHGRFGGDFSWSRMSWIKPNFLWMMYRSGWGVKNNQEITLDLRLSRKFFEEVLAQAVASSFSQSHFANEKDWKAAVQSSDVRLQWDPDHAPNGAKETRRAIQLGLRGPVLERMGNDELLEVIDMSGFVSEQREVLNTEVINALITPAEKVYLPSDETTNAKLKLD